MEVPALLLLLQYVINAALGASTNTAEESEASTSTERLVVARDMWQLVKTRSIPLVISILGPGFVSILPLESLLFNSFLFARATILD
jgi:hypothetical protein